MAHRALVATACLLLLLVPAPADSCDCFMPPPLAKTVRTDAPYVFEGKVVEIVERTLHTARTTPGGGSGETAPIGRAVVFEVRRGWNGAITKRMTVSAPWNDCMIGFEIDRTYVVFARKDDKGVLGTSACNRTVESGKAGNLLALLGEATVPK